MKFLAMCIEAWCSGNLYLPQQLRSIYNYNGITE